MAQLSSSKKVFILLFDGTGNRFSGTDSDSNILKILRLLDRNDTRQVHYYQPGIGTYVQSTTYSHTSAFTRARSWVKKARDAAIGASFDEHVMGGYKFLMRYYQPGDDLFIFGFSRGAYTARYLAEMLDYIGLLEAGNEELARFAWKAFAKWQRRLERTEAEKKEKKAMFEFMKAFRDTFARPIKRIRFLGLFDTVNSVSQFESRWMSRDHHPYTATSSAMVVRHAVSIDERRAKLRQDLLSIEKSSKQDKEKDHASKPRESKPPSEKDNRHNEPEPANPRFRRASVAQRRARSRDRTKRVPELSPARSMHTISEDDRSANSVSYDIPTRPGQEFGSKWDPDEDEDRDEAAPQDVLEVWFGGGHGDIGGGWTPGKEEALLSHVPLVWMVREAQRAGLRFNPESLAEMKCGWKTEYDDDYDDIDPLVPAANIPQLHVTGTESPGSDTAASNPKNEAKDHFHKHLHRAATESIVHDCLKYGGGLGAVAVSAWGFMEYLPFRRMDLQSDSTWRSVRWPLPMGEVRDVPDTAIIHGSVIRRMEVDPKYRPGNLIVGGGGRGVRVAPEELGMGEWDVVRESGDPIGECYIRRNKACNGEQQEKKSKSRHR